jgi:hypothetical protein
VVLSFGEQTNIRLRQDWYLFFEEKIMNRVLIVVIACFVILSKGCTDDDTNKKDDVFLCVNQYSIGKEEVACRLKNEEELNSNFYATKDTQTEFIKDLIQSQLLIQEAKKQRFDQREHFRETIQRYWESTLIRDLLAEKGEHFKQTTVVTEEEVQAYFKTNRERYPDQTFEELQKTLADNLLADKINKRLANWIEELKVEAKIIINDPEMAAAIGAKN